MSEEWMLIFKCAESTNASFESGLSTAVYSDYLNVSVGHPFKSLEELHFFIGMSFTGAEAALQISVVNFQFVSIRIQKVD